MLMNNFTIMMKHFHGPSKLDHDEIMLKRMQYHAQVASDVEESRRIIRETARERKAAVRKIEVIINSSRICMYVICDVLSCYAYAGMVSEAGQSHCL